MGLTPSLKTAPRIAWWLATGFGSGYLKPAPGTWGSLAGLLAWLLLVTGLGRLSPSLRLGLLVLGTAALTLAAVWAAGRVALETGLKDPSFIVADEWAGMWIALTPLLLALPPQPALLWAARLTVPFLLFRLFDIWKPGAVNTAQALPGGWGIVMDDVLAGLLAGLLTWPLDRWLALRF